MASARLDEMEWTSRIPRPGDSLKLDGATVRLPRPGGALLISGNLKAAINRLAKGAVFTGLFEQQGQGAFAIRIARDRALLVTPSPLDVQAGWQRPGYMVTPADDLYVAVSVAGGNSGALMESMMNLPASSSSPSASTMFAGMPALVTGIEGGYCIRVERSLAAALWHQLAGFGGVSLD